MDNQKQAQKNKISEMIESSLDSIRGIADSGTVIGTPVTTPQGTTIIPVSKVSVGFAGGGNVFSGGGGTGISVTPQAFLVVSADGSVELLSIANPTGSAPMSTVGASIDTLIDRAPEIIEKIKSIVGSKKKKADDKDAQAPAEASAETEAEPTEAPAAE